MIADKYKPTSLVSIIGQGTSVKVLEAMIASPESNTKIIVVSGKAGTGKTSIARAFAYDLNRLAIVQGTSFNSLYKEFNGNLFYNEDSIAILESFKDNDKDYIVVNIEEADLIPQYIQVKILELIDSSDRVFYIFSTSDRSKIITPIKNRSMPIDLVSIDDVTMKERLKYIAKEEGIDITEVLDIIVNRAQGNLRLAYDLVDKYSKLGIEIFNEYILNTRIYLIKFLASAFMQDKDKANDAIRGIMTSPLYYVKQDYEALILELLKVRTGVIPKADKYIAGLYKVCSNKIIDLFNIMNNKLLYDMFNNDNELQSALWYIYINIGNLIKS